MQCFLSRAKPLFAAGSVDAVCVLEQIELQIANVKEDAFSRKEILERVEKWLAARDEESWLEDYNRVSCLHLHFRFSFHQICCSICFHFQDENRYNAGRGTHLNLKRAEKARALVSKMPGNYGSHSREMRNLLP